MSELKAPPSAVLVSAHPSAGGSFQNTRVVLHLSGDQSSHPHHHPDRFSDEDDCTVTAYQFDDGPAHLVIGRHTCLDALQRAAHRLAIDVQELSRFQAQAGRARRLIAPDFNKKDAE